MLKSPLLPCYSKTPARRLSASSKEDSRRSRQAIVDLFVDAEDQVATKTDLEAVKHEIISTVTFRLTAATGLLAELLAIFEFAV